MVKIKGVLSPKSFGVASNNLAKVMGLIEGRTGLNGLVPGTLNVKIDREYIVKADATISQDEYGNQETVKLQRCIIDGFKGLIMRPDTHESRPNWGHGKAHLEIMGCHHFKSTLNLSEKSEIRIEVEGDDNWWNGGK